MKKILYTLAVAFAGGVLSCTPDKDKVLDMGLFDMEQVSEIKLQVSHNRLLANGEAQIEFTPVLTGDTGFEIHDSRVDHAQIEYCTPTGEILSKMFSVTDKSLVGKKIEVQARIKGRELVSNTVSFTVEDPAVSEGFPEITVPVVFHVFQANQEITSYGGEFPLERLNLLLDKINHAFSGEVSRNAMGVDTKIRFKAALYDPYGNKLREPGVHRIYMEKVKDETKDRYRTLIREQQAMWPYDKYCNVWLISDIEGEYSNFFHTITKTCIPRYLFSETDPAEAPEGLALSALPDGWEPAPEEVGVLYKLQSILTMVRSFGEKNENELANALGAYLGLLPTWGELKIPQDYCTDTHKYMGWEGYKKNQTVYKLLGDCFFLSENIMDDPVGMHRSVTQAQAQRMHWVLKNCPERSAYKSDYAFTGK